MRCVVIGGGGFIGSHLAETLVRDGNNVTIFDRPGAKYLDELSREGVRIELGSFVDQSDLQRALCGSEIVFHLVSTTVPKTSNTNPVFDIETNLIGTVNLLSIAKKVGVKKIIYASSGGTVYGIPKEIPIDENHPTEPICSYGIVKLAIEKYAHLFWQLYGLDYRILRISNAYGERQAIYGAQGIIPMIIGNGLQGKDINIWGDGGVIRDYIHVSDIVAAFLKTITQDNGPRIFNIGSEHGLSINDLTKIIEPFIGKPLRIKYQHGQPYDVPINILNVSRAKKFLHWSASMSINNGILRTFNYIEQNMKEYQLRP